MSIYNVPTSLGDYASYASAFSNQMFPSAYSPDVGPTSNAYINPFTGQPYTTQDIINAGGGNPNSIINVPHGADFGATYGPYLMLAPMAGMIGAAAAAGGAGAAGAGGAGMTAADAAEASALTGSGVGGLAGGTATGLSGAGAGALGTGAAMTDVVPSFDQILANASSSPMLSTAGSPADYFSAGGITSGSSSLDSLLSGLGGGSSLFSSLGNIGNGLSSLGGSGGGGSNNSILSALGNIGSGSMSLLPGLLALNYARNTSGIDTSGLSGILGRLGGNQDAIVKAATDPLQQNIAAGYGDLLQSQAARGIRGSSFGDTDIANYLSTTGNTLANAGANAAQGSLALQGNLAGEIATLNNQSQLQKNQLYGNAFDVLGRALNPQGYAGSINLGGPNGGFTQTGAANTTSGVGQLLSGLGSLGSSLYNLL